MSLTIHTFISRTLSAIIATICLLHSAAASADPGFFKIDNEILPEVLEKKAAAIFLLIYVQPKPQQLKSDEYETFRADLLRSADAASLTGPSKMLLDELDACVQKSAHECQVTRLGPTGTAFIAKEQNLLWTAAHVIDPVRFEPTKKKIYETTGRVAPTYEHPLPFLLFDFQLQLVFDGRKDSDGVKNLFFGDIHQLDSLGPWRALVVPAIDLTIMKLPRSLNRPLLTFANEIGDGQIFIPGFPGKTTHRETEHHQPDAPGRVFRVSKGKRVALFDCYNTVQGPFPEPVLEAIHKISSINEKMIIATDADRAVHQC
jgi:hypothetical protein